MNAVMITAVLQSTSDIANQFNGYLMLGYFVMWLIVMVYIVSLIVRQRNLKQDLQLMQQILQEHEEDTES
jgi:CcmD family protein